VPAASERIPREAIAARLAGVGYVADRDLATALWMMDYLNRPLLIEGEAGVGKTEVAKALAALHGCELIRMQCYEGLDASSALYEWNYQRQLLAIKAREGGGASASEIEAQIFSEEYLLERPLLSAIRRKTSPVLLVDEVDRVHGGGAGSDLGQVGHGDPRGVVHVRHVRHGCAVRVGGDEPGAAFPYPGAGR